MKEIYYLLADYYFKNKEQGCVTSAVTLCLLYMHFQLVVLYFQQSCQVLHARSMRQPRALRLLGRTGPRTSQQTGAPTQFGEPLSIILSSHSSHALFWARVWWLFNEHLCLLDLDNRIGRSVWLILSRFKAKYSHVLNLHKCI